MKTLTFLPFLVLVTGFEQQCFSPSPILDDPVAQAILSRALADGIDLSVFSFTAPALQEILSWVHFEVSSEFPRSLLELVKNATAIDVHVHYAPKWYGNIRQDSTEVLDLKRPNGAHGESVNREVVHSWIELGLEVDQVRNTRSIFSVPDPNIYLGDEYATVAIARLLNENMAALARALPHQFGFFATIPLPYVDAAIIEGQYALESLDAVGVAVNSNHEGLYLGNLLFDPFFAAMANSDTIVFVHPTAAVLKINQTFVEANPTIYSPILAEFYFETARTFLNLATSQTLTRFPSLDFIIPHLGGSFPSIIDRSIPPGPLLDDVMIALRTRCWWDSAGSTYTHQLVGVLGYKISPFFLLYGSDYPYASPALVDASSKAIMESPFLSEEEKLQVKSGNAQRLFGSRQRSKAS